MDAFYASVEQRDDPRLRGKPVIVGASSPRGVVSAASYEARKYGVRSAMPGFKARELCPHGEFIAGDMKKYAAVSRQIHAIFSDFTDLIEPLALDEAFLDISGSVGLLGSPRDIGQAIKRRVRDELGLVVSVGIGPNKLVAKMACSQGKPNGLLWISEDKVRALLDPLPIRALFGVGPKAEEKLKAKGIVTLGQLAQADVSMLTGVIGDQAGVLIERAQGIDDRAVSGERVAQSIGEEATFPDNVSDESRILSAIVAHSEEVASRARRAGLRGRTVVLKVKLARRKTWGTRVVGNHDLFPVLSRQTRLSSATTDASEIRDTATFLFRKLALTEPVRLIGVTLTDLEPIHDPRQLGLFDRPPSPAQLAGTKLSKGTVKGTGEKRGEALGRAMDAITKKFGDGVIGRAAGKMEKVTASNKIKHGTSLSEEKPPGSKD